MMAYPVDFSVKTAKLSFLNLKNGIVRQIDAIAAVVN